MHLPLQWLQLAAHSCQPLVRDHTEVAIVERDRIARMNARADCVDTEHVPRHEEAGNLLAPVIEQHNGLYETAPHHVERIERYAGAVQRLPRGKPTVRRHERAEPLEIGS